MVKTLDRIWSIVIRLMWRECCARCKSTYLCSAHHMIKRRFMITRFDPVNGILLCAECHDWAESRPLDFMAWLKIKWPMTYEWVAHTKTLPSRRIPPHELKQKAIELKALIARLEKV